MYLNRMSTSQDTNAHGLLGWYGVCRGLCNRLVSVDGAE